MVYLGTRGFPLNIGLFRKSNDESRHQEAAERFIEMLTPIRDRIATERGNHRTVWVRSRMEIGNACQHLRPHLDECDVVRLDAAYQRFKCIPKEAFGQTSAADTSGGAAFGQDQAAVKHVMLASINDMVKISNARLSIHLMGSLSTN